MRAGVHPIPKTAYDITVANRTRQQLSLAFFRSLTMSILSELHARRASIALRFVGSSEMEALSWKFRKRRKSTNVLAFPYENASHGDTIVGDIVLCPPFVRKEAREKSLSLESHLAILLLHAIVHLMGYTHDGETAAERMEGVERRIAKKLLLDTKSK